jgi:hypothetical protein
MHVRYLLWRERDDRTKEESQNRRGDNQICMLKTTPPLMMDAPITNYHATSVRTNHNIYHAPATPLGACEQQR